MTILVAADVGAIVGKIEGPGFAFIQIHRSAGIAIQKYRGVVIYGQYEYAVPGRKVSF